MALFRLRERLEPVCDLVKTFVARGLGHPRIHVGIFVGFTRDRRLQIVGGAADRLAGGRIAALFEKFEMAMRMTGLAFGGGPENGGNIIMAFDIGLLREIQITTVCLALPGERILQALFGLRPLEFHRSSPQRCNFNPIP